jgi:hypothetical protein
VTVFNNIGQSQATVACWIDFNRDGVFGNSRAGVGHSGCQQWHDYADVELQRLRRPRAWPELSALPHRQRRR